MSKKSAPKALSDAKNRIPQMTEFLGQVAKTADCTNIDHYFRSGELSNASKIRELSVFFLRVAMGFDAEEFIPFVGNDDAPDFVPQSEDYYPWALFVVPTAETDLMAVFHRRAMQYLHSDAAGKKNYAVITNFRSLIVCDLKHYILEYDLSFADLHDAINNDTDGENQRKALEAWSALLENFGPASSAEKKRKRRTDVIQYVEPKESHLGLVKRFGNMPSFEKPIGWDNKNFRETFKTKELPFLTTETYDWQNSVKKIENRLIWGDNLAVMRSLPSEIIDLIYIDPPFFSGRNYNCIFGDDDEVRTFSDIWDGGLPTYLAWLSARLWEMKRLLKKTGSIFVHLDWHAGHYVKCELDKIFGYDNFINEIVWCYSIGGKSRTSFARKHDTIFWYSKTPEVWTFNDAAARIPRKSGSHMKVVLNSKGEPVQVKKSKKTGKVYEYPVKDGKIAEDYWVGIEQLNRADKERIGYDTQKPEKLIERLVKVASNPNDLVADFFSGGGSTVVTAEKLGRRWLGCDISRIAISVIRDRLSTVYDTNSGIEKVQKTPKYGFTVENHGAYDKGHVRSLEESRYITFILQCYEAIEQPKGDYIHGFKGEKAVHVAPAKGKASVELIEDFHVELSKKKIISGVILGWSWDKEAEAYIEELRRGTDGPDIQLVQVKLVNIESHEFKGDNIRFLNKPAAVIRGKRLEGLRWNFDGTASQGRNGTDIHYYQWDFNYRGRFNPMTRPSFKEDREGDGNPLNDNRKVEYEFPDQGVFRIALRIIDKSGAESTEEIEINTKAKGREAA